MNRIEQGNLIFDGIDAQASGVLISGEGTFDSPERIYEMVEVPGRNGAVAIVQGRFGNIEVTYPAAIWADTQAAFRNKLAAFRSAMASRIGYKRLEDTYHPDEFRLGIFRGAVEVEPDGYNTAGAFELVFDCKPQRFLKSGEEQVDLSGTSRHTVSGNPISFDWSDSATLHGLSLTLSTKWVSPSGNITPYNSATMEPWDEAEIKLNGETAGTIDISGGIGSDIPEAVINLLTGGYSVRRWMYQFDGSETITRDVYGNYSIPMPSMGPAVERCTRFRVKTYTPGQTLSNGEAWVYNGRFFWRFDEAGNDMASVLAEWAASGQPMVISGLRTTVFTGTVTVPTLTYVADQINTLQTAPEGSFYMDITAAKAIVNPTPFRAYPLVEITGTGTVKIGDTTLTISSNATPPIYLDCELMEAYTLVDGVVTSANAQITMSNHVFPSLPPGASVVQASNGITGLELTPRWWRV